MTSPTASLVAALAAVDRAWGGCGEPDALNDHDLIQVNARLADLRRLVDSAHARIAAEIAARSRPELGKDGLARKTGHRTPIRLIAAATGGHAGDAARLIQVGEATAPRRSLEGESVAPRHPHVAEALEQGTLSVPAGAAITAMLDKLPPQIDTETRLAAEQKLIAHTAHFSLDDVQKALRRAEAMLDPEGLADKVAALRADTWLKIREDAAGHTLLDGRFGPDTAAPIVAAINGIVTHELRLSRGHNHPSAVADGRAPDGATAADADTGADAATTHDRSGAQVSGAIRPPVMGAETRSIPQMNADALAAIARHVIGCDENTVPGASTTVLVRMTLDQLEATPTQGDGVKTAPCPPTIDGVSQPIDAGHARRMAATAGMIPLVLGLGSEILDLGREKRAFTKAQRIALGERDGGCAGCNLPPAFTEAHHLERWSRGGCTDLDVGVLLCTGCHHRVHDDGWEIRIEVPPGGRPHAGTVWFIPPAHIDASRTPRLGGRRRFDPLLWELIA